jgi:hypothetical protein
MNANIAESFLHDQIPLSVQRLLPPRLKLAYEAADQLITSSPMLQVPTARDNRGRMISWAVDHSIKGLIESGEWAVDYRWQLFNNPTGHYLEVRLPHATLSISQVCFYQEQPRNVLFRQNARFGNSQMDFFKQAEDDDAEKDGGGPPSFLLVHGYKELQFAHIGIPHKHHQHGYIYQTPNLLGLLYGVPPSDLPPEESAIDIDELLSLKADIEKWQRDNGAA